MLYSFVLMYGNNQKCFLLDLFVYRNLFYHKHNQNLHFDDVKKLIEILQRLTDGGNTVVVIEHNLDVIKSADYIIDIGPEGGARGGTIVAEGTPEAIAKNKKSYTGEYLKPML